MAEPNGDAKVNRNWTRSWEKFTPEHHSNSRIAFKSVHNRYLSCSPDGQVTADKMFMLEWEAFYIYKSTRCQNRKLGHVCIAFKSASHDTFLRAGRNGELYCDKNLGFVDLDMQFYGWTTEKLAF